MRKTHTLARFEPATLVAAGGAIGAVLRYLLALLVSGLGGTLLANALGSFALGGLIYGAVRTGALTDRGRLFAATGLLSSFTTYSTFVVETVLTPGWALANVLGSYALGFGGVLVARRIVRGLDGGDG